MGARNTILKISTIFIFAVAILSIAGTCQGGLLKPSQHKVGDVIEGTYTVYYFDTLVGYLTLSDGRYSFKLHDNQEATKEIAENIFFGKYPNGSFNTEYWGSVNQNTVLEDLEDADILLEITFDSDKVNDSQVYDLEERTRFLIMNDTDKRNLRLHFTFSTSIRWYIIKPWE